MKIRVEKAEDIEAIRQVNVAAFGREIEAPCFDDNSAVDDPAFRIDDG